jgi:pilus assembly protein FimV
MFNRIHSKLGTAGFIISIVALVAALGGGAYAANSALSGKQKKEVEKIAKKYAGKPGAAGATGPAGAAGAKGEAGTKGDPGAAGVNGTNGTSGAPGAKGAEGSPWTAGGVLPKGKTETGTWTISQGTSLENLTMPVSISFPIPLAAESDKAFGFNAHATEDEEFGKNPNTGASCAVGTTECVDTGCTGTVAAPSAPPGALCIYTAFEQLEGARNAGPEATIPGVGAPGYGKAGAFMLGFQSLSSTPAAPSRVEGFGTWAVTAP